jgi:hypothetical protein
LRRECRMFSAALYARVRFVFHPLHTRPRVQRASGIPCSLMFEGQRNANLGRIPPRDADVYLLFETRIEFPPRQQ